ncbi:MAG TPA: NrfD/PsrC family molybdoenzyme membrane anchor subunit [Thermoanaerobaculia bacterium]|nr:NrfD/PsrC family molybdoenzyme membrane anchor subunit [Thermoanaerobaculia bacterium]
MTTAARREQRLDEIRARAQSGLTAETAGVRPPGAPFPRADAESGYYGMPLLKRPVWTWEVPAYFFVGGAAGAGAVVAAAADLAGGDPRLAHDARWLAAVGGAAAPALLISDLGRPERFLNMLRIFKPQSPMSVGAWTLVAFSTSSAAHAFASLAEERFGHHRPVRVLRDAAGVLAAATGTVMSSYTGVLIGATAIPVWNRNVRVLPVHFTASGLASAVAILELLGHRQRSLHWLGLSAAAVETAVGVYHESDRRPATRPLRHGTSGGVVRTGGLLAGPVALGLRLLGRRSEAAIAALAGSLLTRFGWIAAGRASAEDAATPLQLEAAAEIAAAPGPSPPQASSGAA